MNDDDNNKYNTILLVYEIPYFFINNHRDEINIRAMINAKASIIKNSALIICNIYLLPTNKLAIDLFFLIRSKIF